MGAEGAGRGRVVVGGAREVPVTNCRNSAVTAASEAAESTGGVNLGGLAAEGTL